MAIRNVSDGIKDALIGNSDIISYHLIKFEKPSLSQKVPRQAYEFSYITDAPHEVVWNGDTYTAGIVEKVGTVNETIEARATNMSLQLSAVKLNVSAIVTFTGFPGTLTEGTKYTVGHDIDLFKSGFYPGDTVLIENAGNYVEARIDRLYGSGVSADLTITSQSSTLPSFTGCVVTYNSSEVTNLTSSKSALSFATYVNREVEIYRIYADASTGEWVKSFSGSVTAEPFLLFRGIISKCTVQDKPSGQSSVTWSLSSHWGDFVRVQGRLTSDEFHRALDGTGTANPDAALRKEYAYDLGFVHSEKAINTIATYSDWETRMAPKRPSGIFQRLLGMKEYKEEKYQVQRELDIRINLDAKFIPVVYGVQKVSSIPVFADITNTVEGDSNYSTLYTVNTLCEGPISAIYDIIVDDKTLVCKNQADSDVRAFDYEQGYACMGRAEAGTVLGAAQDDQTNLAIGMKATFGNESTLEENVEYTIGMSGGAGSDSQNLQAQKQADVTRATVETSIKVGQNSETVLAGKKGIKHKEVFFWPDNQDIDVRFYAGHHDQVADSELRNLSRQVGFFVQKNYFKESFDYWGSNHRLLDTAYVIQRDTITADEGRSKELTYVVKGKFIDCYNYDGTFGSSYYPQNDATNAANFNLGDAVVITEEKSGGSTWAARIIDKFWQYDINGNLDYRFRVEGTDANAGTLKTAIEDGTLRKGTMTKGANTWYLQSDDWAPNIEAPQNQTQFFYTPISFNFPAAVTGVTVTRTANTSSTAIDTTSTGIEAVDRQNGVDAEATQKEGTTLYYTVDFSSSNLSAEMRAILDVYKYKAEQSTDGLDFLRMRLTPSIAIPYNVAWIVDPIGWDSATSTFTVHGAVYGWEQVFTAVGSQTIALDSLDIFMVNIMKLSATDPLINDASILDGVTLTLYNEDNENFPQEQVTIQMPPEGTLRTGLTSRNIVMFEKTPQIPTYGTVLVPNVKYSMGENKAQLYGGKARDLRVSNNPAMQVLDYLTNDRYGKGLKLDTDIDLYSFRETARACDAQSDIYVVINKTTNAAAGITTSITEADNYRYQYINSASELLFEGTIKEVKEYTVNSVVYQQLLFTNCIGKLGRKWSSWKVFKADEFIMYRGSLYKKNATPNTVLESEFDNTLNKIVLDVDIPLTPSGAATQSILLSIEDGGVGNENPIVKKYSDYYTTFIEPGYTLYDADDVKYWKLIGWEEQEQRWATRHQLNTTIDTSRSLFDNLNSLLGQFNGILRYSNGKYYLGIKTKAKDISQFDLDYEHLTEDMIIGDVKLEDKGISRTYNSINANVIDPINNFESRSISYFNSDYVAQDKGVRKQGNFSAPSITNYYNARIKVKQELDESRYGLTVSMRVSPKAYLLLAGELILISYARFNWDKKLFRIESLNINEDNTVQLVATEHNDEAYIISATTTQIRDNYNFEGGTVKTIRPAPPTALNASTNNDATIVLNWTNSTKLRENITYRTEIWANTANTLDGNEFKVSTVPVNITTYEHTLATQDSTTQYYWVRHIADYKTRTGTVLKYSNFRGPATGSTNGVNKTVTVYADAADGTGASYTRDAGELYVYFHNYTGTLPAVTIFDPSQGGGGYSFSLISGSSGDTLKLVNAYKRKALADPTIVVPTDDGTGTYADPIAGIDDEGWSANVPDMTADGDVVYLVNAVFSQDSGVIEGTWGNLSIYSRRKDGEAYVVEIETDNGVTFKNNGGVTTLTAVVYNNGVELPDPSPHSYQYTWYAGTNKVVVDGAADFNVTGSGDVLATTITGAQKYADGTDGTNGTNTNTITVEATDIGEKQRFSVTVTIP